MTLEADIPVHLFYGLVGATLVAMGFVALVTKQHVFRKILAWNAMGSGVFVIVGSFAIRNAERGLADALPQAIVITGIVVSVSATALALAIARRLHRLTGDASLETSDDKGTA